MERLKARNLVTIGGYALFFLCLFALVFQIYRLAPVELNSDDASEMILSRLLAEEGGILFDNWYYSTEIRVFQMQIVWAALFRLFGLDADWLLVRTAGTLVGYAAMFGSLFLLCWKMKAARSFPFLALIWAVPFCSDWYGFILRVPYYIPFVVLELLLLTVLVSYVQSAKRNVRAALAAGSVLLSVLTGLCGVRMLIVYHLPTVLAAGALWWSEKSDKKRWLPLVRLVLGDLLSAGIGFLLYSKVLAARYPSAQYMGWYKFSGFSFDRLEEMINTLIAHLGFQTGNLYSTDIIANACCAALILLTIYSLYTILTRKDIFNEIDRFLAASYLSGLAVLTVVTSFTSLAFSGRYLVPVTAFTFPVIFLCFGKRGGAHQWENTAMLALCLGCVLLPGAGWHAEQIRRSTSSERLVVQQTLVEQGYTEGFATFWNGNVITELSDGKIEVWTIDAPNSLEELYPWLQKRTHSTEKPKGKVFLLLSGEELEQCPIGENVPQEDVIYSSDSYIAYGFDSYEELAALYSQPAAAE